MHTVLESAYICGPAGPVRTVRIASSAARLTLARASARAWERSSTSEPRGVEGVEGCGVASGLGLDPRAGVVLRVGGGRSRTPWNLVQRLVEYLLEVMQHMYCRRIDR